MVMRYAFYALGFRFESHLAEFDFVFFFRLCHFPFVLLFFFYTFFQAYILRYKLVLGLVYDSLGLGIGNLLG